MKALILNRSLGVTHHSHLWWVSSVVPDWAEQLSCDFPRSHASNEPISWEPLSSFVPRADSGSLCSYFYSFWLLLSSLVWLVTVFKRCEKCFAQRVCWRDTVCRRATCRGEGSFRVKSPVSTRCYRSHHAAWNGCLLSAVQTEEEVYFFRCAQPSCRIGPCDVKPQVFTLAASLWIPRGFLSTTDLPDVCKHFIQVWLNGKTNSSRFCSLWSPLNHDRAVDGAVSWEGIAGNVKGSSVDDSLLKWEDTASLWKAELAGGRFVLTFSFLPCFSKPFLPPLAVLRCMSFSF